VASIVRDKEQAIQDAGDQGLPVTLKGTVLASVLQKHGLTGATPNLVPAKIYPVAQ
jgi:hypothetical protein